MSIPFCEIYYTLSQQEPRPSSRSQKLSPLGKFEIRRYDDARPFGALGNHLKQKFRLASVKRQITQLVNYEQVEFPEGFLKSG